MKLLLIHPGATWAIADVEAGLRHGLTVHGVDIVRYRLDTRLMRSRKWLHANWRLARKTNPTIQKPTDADMVYHAGEGALAMALRHQVDAVLVVSSMLLHPDVIILMKRAGLRVFVLFTESPYDMEQEAKIAPLVDGCWTNERTVVEDFRTLNPNTWYLPHAWHPLRHRPVVKESQIDAGKTYVAELEKLKPATDVAAHDVVFVGTGFHERAKWFNAVDWTGIDLGLYGSWDDVGLSPALEQRVVADAVDNPATAGLYLRAKIGLNLYRKSKGWGKLAPQIHTAESLNPRAYELAACGVFHLSDARAEVTEVFGDLVPIFTSPDDASRLIRQWLSDDVGRARIAAQLPACVAESSWVQRAACVIGDVRATLGLERNVAAVAV